MVVRSGLAAIVILAGALILTGNASAVAAALSEASTGVAAAVSVVAVGGAVYLCK